MTIIALLLILILIALVFGGDAVVSLFQILMRIVLFGIGSNTYSILSSDAA